MIHWLQASRKLKNIQTLTNNAKRLRIQEEIPCTLSRVLREFFILLPLRHEKLLHKADAEHAETTSDQITERFLDRQEILLETKTKREIIAKTNHI